MIKPVFQVLPIALLFGAATVAVWRGMDTTNHRTPNQHKNARKRRKWF